MALPAEPFPGSRRYEALVVLGDAAWARPSVTEKLATLCATGAAIALISSTRAGAAEARLAGVDPGAGTLLVTGRADRHGWVLDASGWSLIRRPVPSDPGAAPWVLAELWKRGIGRAGVLVVLAGHDRPAQPIDAAIVRGLRGAAVTETEVDEVVAGQLACRQRGEEPRVLPEPGWDITRDGFDVHRLRVNGTLFALADGTIGTSGAPLASYPGLHRWVVAEGVYVGDGSETHLLTLPVAMQLPYEMAREPGLRRVLDLRTGVLSEAVKTSEGWLTSVRFSALARPATVALRAHCPRAAPGGPALWPPADDAPADEGRDGEVSWMRVAAQPGGVAAAAVEDRRSVDGQGVVDRFAVYTASADTVPAPDEAISRVREAAGTSFDRLYAQQRAAWAARWEVADIAIEGDDEAQRTTRFALFHLMGCARDDGEAAVGARGLTGTSYRGHVFWDADTLTLPFLAATHPAAARAMLEYRISRLPAARAIAARLGREGARFPWESAHTGFDVTPASARDRTGRLVPIRTGQLEEHIVAQVAWAASCYVDWTGDASFARGAGHALLVDTARYWASRVRQGPEGMHIYGVIGPDEYHEPVDDNAFTNVMARWNLRRAADAVMDADPDGAAQSEAARWRAIADELIDGFDASTGIYEQFAGFDRLEPLIIADLKPRPVAADLLLGRERVRGAQIIKQADVLMLHHLVPEAVEPDTLDANLDFYEPRTAHGSSLSPGIHASLFARAARYDQALDALRIASRMDLDDLTETTGGGLHLATMGSVWQALVFGFAGVRPSHGRLTIDPRLPPAWSSLEVRVQFHGRQVKVVVGHDRLEVHGDGPTPITVGGADYMLERGRLGLRLQGHIWKEIA